MSEEIYFGFSKQQLQGLDEAAVRLLVGSERIESREQFENRYQDSMPLMFNRPMSQSSAGGEISMPGKVTNEQSHDGFLTTLKYPKTNEYCSADQQIGTPTKQDPSVMPIAIVGMSCRFSGGANNLEDMWRLCSEGRSAWSEIPKSRFNADAFYHPDPERTNSMNVKSGHFLQEDQFGYFDASFFNISPNEAKAMDPQARMHLEGAYEALENGTLTGNSPETHPRSLANGSLGGVPICELVGSDTSVFVGTFNADYKLLMTRDPNTAPVYKATGSGMCMLANRISHWFDLKGPSITMDTACSASTAALHMACESLRTSTSKLAIVSGANLILEPEAMLSLSSLSFLNPEGKTYMFDQRANGYARGEGIGTLVLKPLSDALKSNDSIHAVIRNTGMNQDGRTPGITLPSMNAQRTLIEETYRRAGIDPGETDFFEAHGTGTQAGDRIEAEALSKALRSFDRDSERPLYVGSVKSLIGHCEGASGVAGVIHATMSLKGQCILPNRNFEFPSDQINFRDWKIKVPTEKERWSSTHLRRVSVNSFGYGGTNVHAIVEEAPGDSRMANGYEPKSTQPSDRKVLFLSANEEESLKKLAHNIADYIQKRKDPETFKNLIYTLGQRRSLLRYRLALATSGSQDLGAALITNKIRATRVTRTSRLCFVFTGQGAQWAGMGRELLSIYPVYEATFSAASTTIADLGAEWSLLDELLRDSKASKVDAASVSQPLCTALQIALVELLRSWGIKPVSVVGHSSGEIAAAYCTGMLSLESAMQVAYYRGKFAMELEETGNKDRGRMMAVGLSQDEVQAHLLELKSGQATIACINSPKSVTVSGDAAALDELHEVLEGRNVFSRLLRVQVAYHSHHMRPVAKKYAESLASLKTKFAGSSVEFNSTVFPGIQLATNAEYWVQNLLSPVRFNDAVQKICSNQSDDSLRTDLFVEVGPHSALAGPLRQICADLKPNLRPLYLSSIERRRSSVDSMLELASNLFNLGVEVDAGKINFASGKQDYQVLTDLPSYPWNHTTRYWHNGRISQNYLQREFPKHDLLGTITEDCSQLDMRWTNQLRLTEIPWLRDHTIGSDVIFPGAGYVAMAIEAARQKANITDAPIKNFVLREVSFSTALIIPDTQNGVEVILLLEPLQESSMTTSRSWDTFRILSYSADRKATEHCRGLVSTVQEATHAISDDELQALSGLSIGNQEGSKTYEQLLNRFEDAGIRFGETFQLLSECSFAANKTTCNVRIPDTRSSMPYEYESPQVVGASVLDASLQVSIIGIANLVDTFDGPLLPTFIKELFVSKDISNEQNHKFRAHGNTSAIGPRNFSGEALIVDRTPADSRPFPKPVIWVKGLRAVFVPALKGASELASVKDKKRCWNTVWKPDVTFSNQKLVGRLWNISAIHAEEVASNFLHEKAAFFCIRKALESLQRTDCQDMLPHHQKFVKWAYRKLKLGETGSLPYQSADWYTNDEEVIQSTLQRANGLGAREKMTVKVGYRILDVLHQRVDPLSLMMENDLLDQYYADQKSQDRAYGYAAHYIDLAAHKWPNLRILEIGAGTGSATAFVLNALNGQDGAEPRCSSYHFTDISAGFFEKARSKFSAWTGSLEFKTLNIENDIQSQGFEREGYDLVVAANVLHATAEMQTTMKNVNTLLRPGGMLVLVEVTNPSQIAGPMVFGLLPGWWMGVNDGRGDSPLLSEDQWSSLLQHTGFTGLDICARDTSDLERYILSTMVTSKREEHSECWQDIAIMHASPSDNTLAQQLRAALQDKSWQANRAVTSIEDSPHSVPCYVLIDDRNGSIVPDLTEQKLKALQQLFATGKGFLWVTFGGLIESENVEAGAVLGLLRALRSEFGSIKCVTLDMQSTSTHNVVSTISSVVEACFKGNFGTETFSDLEFAERDGHLLIPRLVADESANEAVEGVSGTPIPEPQPLWQANNPLRLEMRHMGLLDSFQFISDSSIQVAMNDEEVEIEVKCTSMNFRSLMVATGQIPDSNGFGEECSGIIAKVGRAVDNFHPGQRVCACAFGCIGTHTRTSKNLVCAIPESMSFEVAATIPSVFCTSYYSLYHAARLQPGETILIHSAAGGVGQACIKLASLIGATIFVTVGTPDKAQFLEKTYGLPESHILNSRDLSFGPKIMALTADKGVDVIVNSLAGDALRESWSCIAMFGRFIELGKKDAMENAHIGMAPFEKSASYIAVGYELISAYKGTIAAETMRQVMDMFARGALTPLEPITVYSMSEVEKAFRFMQSGMHMGKIVITASRDCSVSVVPKPPPGLKLCSDASYLIVGGLTGIGAAFARWMVSRWSAKHLILLSRSGIMAKGASDLVTSLQQAGATIEVASCDVADSKQLEATLQNCSKSLPPIRGVIQGAMVLEDSIFMNMTLSKYFAALNPKIKGSKNLHDYFLSRSLHLDFFVMLSSLAGVNGNAAQCNYAAGNTYQDALAYHRLALGLPALTIDVGMVVDTGWSVDNWDQIAFGVGLAWAKKITTEHLLRLIEHNILNSTKGRPNCVPVAPQVAIGIDAVRPWDARYSHIALSRARSPLQQLSANDHISLADKIAAAGSDKELLQTVILEGFCRKLSRLLDLPVENIQHNDTLSGYGVDSLVAVEIRNWLGKEALANVPMSEVLDGRKTIIEMVQGIVKDKLRA